MAKGLRSSVKKANKARLRVQVFGPVEEARKERLSAKLLALASQSKEKTDQTDAQMDVEEEDERDDQYLSKGHKDHETERVQQGDQYESMEDEESMIYSASQSSSRRKKGRIEKKSRRKPSSSAVFPVYKKGVRVGGRPQGRRKNKE